MRDAPYAGLFVVFYEGIKRKLCMLLNPLEVGVPGSERVLLSIRGIIRLCCCLDDHTQRVGRLRRWHRNSAHASI